MSALLLGREWVVPELARAAEGEAAQSMVLIAEAFARGNSKTDGFRSRVVPVPKAVVDTMLGPMARDLAEAQIDAISKVDKALRNGLALIAASGERDNLGNAQYARSQPARAALHKAADAAFFPALWAKLEAGSESEIGRLQHAFVRHLARTARDEFDRAAPGIPCSRILRPRAEVRGRAALNAGLARMFNGFGIKEAEHVETQ